MRHEPPPWGVNDSSPSTHHSFDRTSWATGRRGDMASTVRSSEWSNERSSASVSLAGAASGAAGGHVLFGPRGQRRPAPPGNPPIALPPPRGSARFRGPGLVQPTRMDQPGVAPGPPGASPASHRPGLVQPAHMGQPGLPPPVRRPGSPLTLAPRHGLKLGGPAGRHSAAGRRARLSRLPTACRPPLTSPSPRALCTPTKDHPHIGPPRPRPQWTTLTKDHPHPHWTAPPTPTMDHPHKGPPPYWTAPPTMERPHKGPPRSACRQAQGTAARPAPDPRPGTPPLYTVHGTVCVHGTRYTGYVYRVHIGTVNAYRHVHTAPCTIWTLETIPASTPFPPPRGRGGGGGGGRGGGGGGRGVARGVARGVEGETVFSPVTVWPLLHFKPPISKIGYNTLQPWPLPV